ERVDRVPERIDVRHLVEDELDEEEEGGAGDDDAVLEAAETRRERRAPPEAGGEAEDGDCRIDVQPAGECDRQASSYQRELRRHPSCASSGCRRAAPLPRSPVVNRICEC